MKKLIFGFLGLLITLTSCKSDPTVESYFVENQENKDFIFLDISPQMLGLDKSKLTVEQSKALAQFEKVNVLAFKKSETNDSLYGAEKAKVSEILKDKKYEQLMRFGSGKAGAVVKALSEGDKVNEFVLFGYESENGFALVRILGTDMTADSFTALLPLMQQGDLNLDQLKPLQAFVK
ncbi:DUF4252 domain-containing protein [Flavobacterium sp.]|uniref:DUF4252 domain-containing protein n=1 Tax=Flavobacterium sp. TaxID=239 RepID=UPI00261E092D|nr:DUF4252 domain-containing protein [Flavobacterium sp.]